MAKIVNQEERTNSPSDGLISLPEDEKDSQARANALGNQRKEP